ncbi:MAG: hypothetical protein R3A46_15250 [Thermomicrobiales bacterium]
MSHGGSAWIATSDNINQEPGVGADWDLLASRGETGPAGSGGSGGGFPDTYLVVTETSQGSTVQIDGTTYREHIALCDAGDKVLSGGFWKNPRRNLVYQFSEPLMDVNGQQGWHVVFGNTSDVWYAMALCADTTP